MQFCGLLRVASVLVEWHRGMVDNLFGCDVHVPVEEEEDTAVKVRWFPFY